MDNPESQSTWGTIHRTKT